MSSWDTFVASACSPDHRSAPTSFHYHKNVTNALCPEGGSWNSKDKKKKPLKQLSLLLLQHLLSLIANLKFALIEN